MAKKRELWERQKWDTRYSFAYFHKYYLAQVPPRSLNKAYKKYRLEKDQERGRPKEATKAWRNWYKARDYSGNDIVGAIGWADRAALFDDYCAKHNIDQWIKRREKVRKEDWLLGEELRDLALSILEEGPSFLIQKRKFVKGKAAKKGEAATPDKMIITLALDINAAVKAGGLASKLQRLAAGMETENLAGEFDILQQVTVILPDNLRGDRGVDEDEQST